MRVTTAGFGFRVLAWDGAARAGVLTTPHGEVPTPAFMPVGTRGSVKMLMPEEVAATGARIVLGNAYHLWLRPGPERVARLGGLHAFTRWPGAMLTDSGGYQAFSLAGTRVSDDGFTFRSHLDGSRYFLSPEEAMRIQGLLGADIAMALDVCPPAAAEPSAAQHRLHQDACRRTSAWARRCLAAKRELQALFGIVQGGTDLAMRLSHLEDIAGLPFDGLALGGFSVGEPNRRMHEVLAELVPRLDPERPRYLMGVGTPLDLLRAVRAGVDMFDCVLPTRNARNGQALVPSGRIGIKQARYADDGAPLDPDCGCPACRGGYARAYLRHLFLAGEGLAGRLLSLHNLQLYGTLMAQARQAILDGRFDAFAGRWSAAALASGDREPAADPA
ncbi:MAG: tRNA guanosine(34) transglycosylase Tgt [Deltaproteobacteria bacterium]|nr:tRNA guanosine(34) transglycosylase Tgt [Deltaproteobacteria bacterium]